MVYTIYMHHIPHTKEKGFVSTIILVVIALIILQFVFHVNVLTILQSPQVQVVSNFIVKYTLIAWYGLVHLYQTLTT